MSQSGSSGSETWMVDAAQNLAYLKNTTPSRSSGVTTPPGGHEITPVPSLTASGSISSKDDDNSQGGGVYGDERSRSPSNNHNNRNDIGSTGPKTDYSGNDAGTMRN